MEVTEYKLHTGQESKYYFPNTHFLFSILAYQMKLVLPRPDALPTDASLECFWGDGETLSAEVQASSTLV